MRAWVLTSVAVLLLWACAAELPSTTPLGRGPLAEPDRDPSEEVASSKRAESRAVDGGADQASPPPATPEEPTASAGSGADQDAGADADTDAGADAEAPQLITKVHVFAGDYSGNDTTTIRWEGQPELVAPDPKARIKITRVSDAEVEIVVIYTPTGGPFCTVSAEVKDNVATITAGQTCPDAGVGAGFTGTVTSGTAKVTGRRLVVDVELDIETTGPGQRQSGTASYHFEGWRRLD